MSVVDEEKPTPAEVRSRLRVIEDHNMALRLQEEEFHHHYDQNRSERRTVGSDTKKSRSEQEKEDYVARQMRMNANRRIEESDEEMARRIANQWEEEANRERLNYELQLRRDEELARRMAEGGSSPIPATQEPNQNQLLDFSTASPHHNSQNFQSSWRTTQSTNLDRSANQPSYQIGSHAGVPLPGMAERARASTINATPLPPAQLPVTTLQPTSTRMRSESIDSPVSWPAPPPALRTETTFPVVPPTVSHREDLPYPPSVPPSTVSHNGQLPYPLIEPMPQPPSTFEPPVPSQAPSWMPSAAPLSATNPFFADLQPPESSFPTNAQTMPSQPNIESVPMSSLSISNQNTVDSQVLPPPPPYENYTASNAAGQTSQYHSEFGLPPPSALAQGTNQTSTSYYR